MGYYEDHCPFKTGLRRGLNVSKIRHKAPATLAELTGGLFGVTSQNQTFTAPSPPVDRIWSALASYYAFGAFYILST